MDRGKVGWVEGLPDVRSALLFSISNRSTVILPVPAQTDNVRLGTKYIDVIAYTVIFDIYTACIHT